MDRPTSVSVIGWFFIIVGGLSAMSGTLAIMILMLEGTWSNLLVLAVVQVIIAVITIGASLYFLKGSRRARYILEGVAWLVLFALVWFYYGFAPPFLSDAVGIGMVMINFLIMAVPLCLVIHAIRGKTVSSYIEYSNAL